VGSEIVRSQTITVTAGNTSRIRIDSAPPSGKEATKPSPPPPPAAKPIAPAVVASRPAPTVPSAPPTPRVTSDGDAGSGAGVVAACNACHTSKGASAFAPRLYTRAQWERFFANGQHDRYGAIGDRMSASQMMAARAYLRANAADTSENQGAGIRE
jgi:hypothetical protein